MGSKKKPQKSAAKRPAKKAPTKKAPVKKAPARKSVTKKAPAKTRVATKPVRRGTKSPARRAAKPATRKVAKAGAGRASRQSPAKKVLLPRKSPGARRASAPRSSGQKQVSELPRTVVARLCVSSADAAIAFYTMAFDAFEVYRIDGPGGNVLHAMLRIGDSVLHLQDEMQGAPLQSPSALAGVSASLDLHVPDVDATFARALAAGAELVQAVEDTFWGDRAGTITDPFGHVWTIATHVREMTPAEIQAAATEFSAAAAVPEPEEEWQPTGPMA